MLALEPELRTLGEPNGFSDADCATTCGAPAQKSDVKLSCAVAMVPSRPTALSTQDSCLAAAMPQPALSRSEPTRGCRILGLIQVLWHRPSGPFTPGHRRVLPPGGRVQASASHCVRPSVFHTAHHTPWAGNALSGWRPVPDAPACRGGRMPRGARRYRAGLEYAMIGLCAFLEAPTMQPASLVRCRTPLQAALCAPIGKL